MELEGLPGFQVDVIQHLDERDRPQTRSWKGSVLFFSSLPVPAHNPPIIFLFAMSLLAAAGASLVHFLECSKDLWLEQWEWERKGLVALREKISFEW